MAPLAGKPPFATDKPDSYYQADGPAPRRRPPPPAEGNKRTSAYDVYDNYLPAGAGNGNLAVPPSPNNRNSGIGNMLLNMDDDSDDSDDDEPVKKPQAAPSPSKNAALAAAVQPPPSQPAHQQPPQPQQHRPPPPPQHPRAPPQIIAAPRPGYAAPIAALNLARPDQAGIPPARGPPQPLALQNPFEPPFAPPSPMRQGFSAPGSPAPSSPHPLQPPITPIQPAFIRPATKAPAPSAIKFEEGVATPRPPKVIMRGNSEETLLPSRGEKGDDFWRRFSFVAKEESKNGRKESSWLAQMRSGSKSHSRWVWIVGIILIILIGGGIGAGVYFTRNTPDHQQPTVIGGTAGDNLATPDKPVVTDKAAAGTQVNTVKHVSPTHTLAGREDENISVPTGAPYVVLPVPVVDDVVKRHLAKRRLSGDVW